MRCELLLPYGASPLRLDPIEPVLTAELLLFWPGRSVPFRTSAVVDTGCPVEMVASTDLASMMRQTMRQVRTGSLDWGGRLDADVYEVDLKLGDWRRIEVHAPREPFGETLLGLRALLRANLCIRGEDTSAHWVDLPDAGDTSDFIARDADAEDRPLRGPRPARTAKRTRRR